MKKAFGLKRMVFRNKKAYLKISVSETRIRCFGQPLQTLDKESDYADIC